MSNSSELLGKLNPVLGELAAYTPTAGDFEVRLDANEAPNLLSEAARARLVQAFASIDFQRYPDAQSLALRTALGARSGVGPERILAGVGSDEVIGMLLTSFRRPSERGCYVLTLSPTFVMYRLSGKILGHQVLEVPLDDNWDLNTNAALKALEFAAPSLIFIASPNNPTGTMPSEDRLRTLIEHAKGALVVIDEAYIDYASRDQLHLLDRFENVAILRTLSKVGFAALRLGWLIARPELIQELNKVRLPYNLPTPTQVLGTLVVNELSEELLHIRNTVLAERARLTRLLEQRSGVELVPSQANFLWLKTEAPAEQLFEGLKQRGVLVRSFHKSGGRLKHYLRVTIGLPVENDKFLEALEALI